MTAPAEPVLFYTPGACSLACMVALAWAGEPYLLCRVEKDVRAGDLFRRINPRAQVPALRLGPGRTLVETNAILTHIADGHPAAGLLPPNAPSASVPARTSDPPWERDLANQWLAYLGSGFHPPFWAYFYPERYVNDVSMHPAVKQAAAEAIARELRTVNAQLAEREFFLDSGRSVLDGYLYSMARWANKIVDVPADHPHLWRHQKVMAKDPAMRLAVAIERGDATSAPPQGPFKGHVELADML